jgi:hypothetical protein
VVSLRRDPPKANKTAAFGSTIPTAGSVFEDGVLIELIDDPKQPDGVALLMWDGRKKVKARRVVHGGCTFAPLALDPGLRRALRLPASSSQIDSTAKLFAELLAVVRRFTDLSEDSCAQLIGFVFASWLPDCLPAPINLALWAPDASEAARVLLLLSCLCRQSLPLCGVSARDLDLLPSELQPTLLILRPASGRRTMESLSTCGWNGFHTARSGRFAEFTGSVAVSSETPIEDCTLDPLIVVAVPAGTRPLPVLDQKTRDGLAKDFLPKLLGYRLQHYQQRTVSGSTNPGFSGSSPQLAAGICTCFADEPELRDRQLALMTEANRDERSADPRVPLIEVLWVRCHEAAREKLYVSEIAADLNAKLSLDSYPVVSCRWVGSLLKAVGLWTSRLDRQGRGIHLSSLVRRQVHDLAATYDVPSSAEPRPGCTECAHGQVSVR